MSAGFIARPVDGSPLGRLTMDSRDWLKLVAQKRRWRERATIEENGVPVLRYLTALHEKVAAKLAY